MTGPGRAVRWSTTGVVVGVAVVAAIVSYRHALSVVRAHGEDGPTAYLLPLTVDGLIYAASMVMLTAARQRVSVPPLARVLLGLGIVATLAANVMHGAGSGPVGAVVAAWPAVALVGSYELLMWVVRTGRGPALGAGEGEREPGDEYMDPELAELQVQAAEEFAEELARGSVPGIKRIRKRLFVGQPRAKRIQAYLETQVRVSDPVPDTVN